MHYFYELIVIHFVTVKHRLNPFLNTNRISILFSVQLQKSTEYGNLTMLVLKK